jgi:hypothetical protein
MNIVSIDNDNKVVVLKWVTSIFKIN